MHGKIVVGKVIVAKAIGIFLLYIGRIRFVINRLGKRKRMTERKKNQLVIHQKLVIHQIHQNQS